MPLCLCASVLILSQRLRDTEFHSLMPSGIFTSTLSASLRVRPCDKRKVVSRKLFPKIEGFCGELLEVRVNENLMRKILKH